MTSLLEPSMAFTLTRPVSVPRVPAGGQLLSGRGPASRSLHIRSYDQLGQLLPLPPWAVDAEHQLQRLRDLPPAWDGRRAQQVTEPAVESLVALLGEVMEEHAPFPQYFPLPDGGLQAEWHADGHDLELEVEADGSVHALGMGPGGVELDLELQPAELDAEAVAAVRLVVQKVTGRVAAAR